MPKHKSRIINPKWLDKLVYVAVLTPFLAIPQVYNVWTGEAEGVSITTWFGFLVMAYIWLAYALYHRIKPLIFVHTGWIAVNTAVVLGLLLK